MMNKNEPGPEGGPDQVYIADAWSRYAWSRYVEADDSAKDILERGREKIYSFPRFGREVFARLFGDDVDPVEQVRPEDHWAVDAQQELGDLPDFERLRRRCRADRVTAGAAATKFAETVLEKMPNPSAAMEDPEHLREQVRGLIQFAKNLAATGGDGKEVDDLLADLRLRGQRAVRAAVEHAEAVDPTELRVMLRAACDAAHEAADQVEAQLGAFCGWGSGAGIEQNVGLEVKAELARRVGRSDKLQTLALVAGRLRRIAAAKQRSKVDHAREVVDIELGADIERVLTSELVKLTDPVLSLEFARRFCERGLPQYKLGGKEPQSRGPIVLCVDESSSMEGPREIWSKALALALLQVATTQKRWCRVVHFNKAVVRTDDFPPGKVDPLELLRSMEQFEGGGTALEPPLRAALKAIEHDAHLKKADVVLVTDGEAEASEDFCAEWTAARQRFEFTCYAVHVDAAGGVAPPQLHAVADTVIGLADVANDITATEVLFDI